MECVSITDSDGYRAGMTEAFQVLRRGGVVVLPTDTVYGIAADATNSDAVRRLYKIKHRSLTKPVPVFVSSLAMAKAVAYVDSRTERALSQVWPGAVTVVLPVRSLVSPVATAGGGTIAVRISDHPVPTALVEKLGKPIVGTSANVSGEPPRHSAAEVVADFRGQLFKPDLVLDFGRLEEAPPATVLDLTSPFAKVVRAGPVSKEVLSHILQPTRQS